MPSLQLTLTDPAMGDELAMLAQRLDKAQRRLSVLRYTDHGLAPDEADKLAQGANQERTLCAAALLLYLPNQRRAIVGRNDEVGRWEISREHGNHVTARPYPYREDEWESLDGDKLSDYQDTE